MNDSTEPTPTGAHEIGTDDSHFDTNETTAVAAAVPVEQQTAHQTTSIDSRPSRSDDIETTSVLRVPTFSPVAPIVGLLAAWGTIVVASAILTKVGLDLGFNLGFASGGAGDDGFWAGIWLLIVNAGGFVVGGYTAARLARANGTRHAVAVWIVAMAATAADAVVDVIESSDTGTIRLIPGVPFWTDSGLTSVGRAIAVLAVFAAAALIGSIVGGGFGQTANRIDRTDDAIVDT